MGEEKQSVGTAVNERYIKRCPSCDLADKLGRSNEAGIVEFQEEERLPPPSVDEGLDYLAEYHLTGGIKRKSFYRCALGEEGKDCEILRLYPRK